MLIQLMDSNLKKKMLLSFSQQTTFIFDIRRKYFKETLEKLSYMHNLLLLYQLPTGISQHITRIWTVGVICCDEQIMLETSASLYLNGGNLTLRCQLVSYQISTQNEIYLRQHTRVISECLYCQPYCFCLIITRSTFLTDIIAVNWQQK